MSSGELVELLEQFLDMVRARAPWRRPSSRRACCSSSCGARGGSRYHAHPHEREAARLRAHRVLQLADPATVRWWAFCADCAAESGEVSEGSTAELWQSYHARATQLQHEVFLLAVFRLQGGEGTFGVFV